MTSSRLSPDPAGGLTLRSYDSACLVADSFARPTNKVAPRRASGSEVEFVVINLFDSLDAVRAFAGPEYEVAVFEPEARRLLSKAEPIAVHFEVRAQP